MVGFPDFFGPFRQLVQSVNSIANALLNLAPFTNTPTLASVLFAGGAPETPLSHYQEGVWTPTLTFGGAAVGMTGTFQGTFTRIGREVRARFHIVLTAKGASAGAASIGGLPYPSNADPTNAGAGGVLTKFATMAGMADSVLQVGASSNAIALLSGGAAATAALTDGNFNNTSEIDGCVTYFI